MRQWFRKVLPSDRVIGLFVVGYLSAYGLYWLMFWLSEGQIEPSFLAGRDIVLVAAAVMYGAYRVAAFHPLCRPEYNAWLERTPWTIRKPLPVGPIQIVPQDALLMFVLYLLAAHYPYIEPERLFLCFLFSYLAQVAMTYGLVGLSGYSYALAFGLGLVFRLWANWQVALAVAAALYPVALSGLRQSFLRFPWSFSKSSQQLIAATEDTLEKIHPSRRKKRERPQELLGWPYDRLSPQFSGVFISYRHGILLSLLAGWWIYVLAALLFEATGARPAFRNFAGLTAVASISLALFRLGVYCQVHHPPINLWGRVLTFRWIIPGYDRVLVAPLLAVALSSLSAMLLIQRPLLPPEVSVAVPPTLALFAVLNVGPTFEEWRLTGSHRVVHGYSNQAKERSELVEI